MERFSLIKFCTFSTSTDALEYACKFPLSKMSDSDLDGVVERLWEMHGLYKYAGETMQLVASEIADRRARKYFSVSAYISIGSLIVSLIALIAAT